MKRTILTTICFAVALAAAVSYAQVSPPKPAVQKQPTPAGNPKMTLSAESWDFGTIWIWDRWPVER